MRRTWEALFKDEPAGVQHGVTLLRDETAGSVEARS